MSRLLSFCASTLALTLWIAAADAQSPSPATGNAAIPPGTPVSPSQAPDASTQRGQGVEPRANQPAPPPSSSQYMDTQTDSGPQSGSTLPGSPVSPVPAPDASTAPAQERQNAKEAIGSQQGAGITEQK
jgi:hypothetical protein